MKDNVQQPIKFKTFIKEGREFQIIPNGTECGDPACNSIDRCRTCFRLYTIGEAKIPTGRDILRG